MMEAATSAFQPASSRSPSCRATVPRMKLNSPTWRTRRRPEWPSPAARPGRHRQKAGQRLADDHHGQHGADQQRHLDQAPWVNSMRTETKKSTAKASPSATPARRGPRTRSGRRPGRLRPGAVGRSEFAARAAGDAVPMRDAFAVLLFVSVGMLFDPRSLVQVPLLIGAVLAVVVVGKPFAALLTVRALGVPLATAIPVGAAFSQVGEFSFILGTVARQLGLLADDGWNALVAASIISIAINPSLYRWARKRSSSAPALTPFAGGRRPAIDPRR